MKRGYEAAALVATIIVPGLLAAVVAGYCIKKTYDFVNNSIILRREKNNQDELEWRV